MKPSRKMKVGEDMISTAIETRFFCPPDIPGITSLPIKVSLKLVRPIEKLENFRKV